MLDVIRSTQHRVGLKPSGGIRDLAAASTYLRARPRGDGPVVDQSGDVPVRRQRAARRADSP